MIEWNGEGGCPLRKGDFAEIQIFTSYDFKPTFHFIGIVNDYVVRNRIWNEYDKRFHRVFFTRNPKGMSVVMESMQGATPQ